MFFYMCLSLRIPADIRADTVLRCPVVGKAGILHIEAVPDNHLIGIAEHRKQLVLHNAVKRILFIEQKHSVPVKITHVI